MCIDFEIIKAKVPFIFSGTQCFPARRDGRYSTSDFPRIVEISIVSEINIYR